MAEAKSDGKYLHAANPGLSDTKYQQLETRTLTVPSDLCVCMFMYAHNISLMWTGINLN